METLDEVLSKRDSFSALWNLLSPKGEFDSKETWRSCLQYWNSLPLQRQRQIYYTLRQQAKRNEPFKDHPYYAIKDCRPAPINYNGMHGLDEMMKTEYMVSACYRGTYGIYTKFEAWLFEMTDRKPLNFKFNNDNSIDLL